MDKKKTIYENVKLPKNWGRIRIDGKLVNPTVKEILTVQGEDNQDYKIKKICPDCNKKYVEEPKPECDHIVGVTGWVDSYCYDGDKVKLSELLKNDTMTRNLYDLEDIKERFYFCHKKGCGQAIDWEEIEKKLNT